MKPDVERVATIKGDILNYLDELDGVGISSASDLKNRTKYHATSMIIFQIINRVIDLGEELLGMEGIKAVPSSYREIFLILRDRGAISPLLYKKLDDLVKTRNILAHEYENFVEADTYNAYGKIGAAREFLDVIESKMGGHAKR